MLVNSGKLAEYTDYESQRIGRILKEVSEEYNLKIINNSPRLWSVEDMTDYELDPLKKKARQEIEERELLDKKTLQDNLLDKLDSKGDDLERLGKVLENLRHEPDITYYQEGKYYKYNPW